MPRHDCMHEAQVLVLKVEIFLETLARFSVVLISIAHQAVAFALAIQTSETLRCTNSPALRFCKCTSLPVDNRQ